MLLYAIIIFFEVCYIFVWRVFCRQGFLLQCANTESCGWSDGGNPVYSSGSELKYIDLHNRGHGVLGQ